MNRLAYIFVWLSRICHSRGFGVQSPTDYRFVRYVVNEHWPYYKYVELGRNDDWLTRRLGRLYFRLANWRQPQAVLDFGDVTGRYADYMKAGCERAEITVIDGGLTHDEWRGLLRNREWVAVGLIRTTLAGDDSRAFVRLAVENADEQAVLVVEGIHQNKEQLSFWRNNVEQAPEVTVTFDLYYCGIAWFDRKRAKQHYKINF